MKHNTRVVALVTTLGALVLGGCANSDNGLTTASLTQPTVAKAATIDPACVSLTAKIDGLRKEGTMSRLAKVSKGKSRSTFVKRTALAKAAELDSANAEFQAKCSTFKPATTAAAAPPVTTAVQNAVIKSAKKAARDRAAKTVKTAATKAVIKAVKK